MGSNSADVGLLASPRVPPKLPLSTHLATLEGRTAKLAFELWLVVSRTGIGTQANRPTRFESLGRIHNGTLLVGTAIGCSLLVIFF